MSKRTCPCFACDFKWAVSDVNQSKAYSHSCSYYRTRIMRFLRIYIARSCWNASKCRFYLCWKRLLSTSRGWWHKFLMISGCLRIDVCTRMECLNHTILIITRFKADTECFALRPCAANFTLVRHLFFVDENVWVFPFKRRWLLHES